MTTRSVPTFTVKFGPVDAADLVRVAELTGGKQFTAQETRLVGPFRQIRAYQ